MSSNWKKNLKNREEIPKKMEKLKLIAELSEGDCLDIGFAQKPNRYLKNATGVDLQDVPKPDNYKEVFTINLNKQKLPFNDKIFDTVIAGDLIEHVENPSHLLREMNRVLRQNGKIVLSTPHANHLWTILHNWFLRSFVNDPDRGEHLQNWTILDMIRLLKINGFKMKKLWGTECEFPITKIKIPVKHFPMLGWVVIYEARKIANPSKIIHVNYKGKPKIEKNE
jgi:SAM-dependent methyltransferase